jgi:hypothetical protein
MSQKHHAIAFVAHHDRSQWERLGWVYLYDEDRNAAVGSVYAWSGAGAPEYPADDLFLKMDREKQLADFDAVWPGDDQ